jgi:5'-nucleotidase
VRVAIDELGVEPDVVVAGINEGQNLGPLVDISGTVGAARAAVERGVPALAVSQGLLSGGEPDYDSAVPYVLEWVESHRTVFVEGTAPDEIANMNVPTCDGGLPKEPIEVPLATVQDGAIAPQDCASTLEDPPDDITAFNAGYVTISQPIPAERAA